MIAKVATIALAALCGGVVLFVLDTLWRGWNEHDDDHWYH